jgi:hypothetical protein
MDDAALVRALVRLHPLQRDPPRPAGHVADAAVEAAARDGGAWPRGALPGEVAGEVHYRPTAIANELEPILFALGKWAHRNVNADVTLEHLDARVLMWNLRRKVNSVALPQGRRSVVQFIFPELPHDEQSYWLVARPGTPVDLCLVDPAHDVDLFITADLKAMTSAWLGLSSLDLEIARGRIELIGDRHIASAIGNWMVRSSYAA